jgi:hypothetical protein
MAAIEASRITAALEASLIPDDDAEDEQLRMAIERSRQSYDELQQRLRHLQEEMEKRAQRQRELDVSVVLVATS